MIQGYVDFIYDLNAKLENTFGRVETWIETNFVAQSNLDYSGTADFAALANDHLVIVDLKTGFSPVRLRDTADRINSQLGSYGLLVYDNLSREQQARIKTIEFWIYQPRVHFEPVSITIDIDELLDFGEYVESRMILILGGDQTRVGGDHCKYCLTRGNCKAQREFVMEQAKSDFTAPIDTISAESREFNDAELVNAAEELEAIKVYVAAVEEQLYRRMNKGHALAGWKLVNRRAVAKWLDAEAAEKAVSAELGDDAFRRTLRTPGQIEKALEKAGSWFIIDDLFDKKSSGTTIARSDDRRAAVTVNPGDDFK